MLLSGANISAEQYVWSGAYCMVETFARIKRIASLRKTDNCLQFSGYTKSEIFMAFDYVVIYVLVVMIVTF